MHHTTCNTQDSTCRSMQALLQERVWLLDHGLHGTADHPKLVCIKSRPECALPAYLWTLPLPPAPHRTCGLPIRSDPTGAFRSFRWNDILW
jgi:hypothetical protein